MRGPVQAVIGRHRQARHAAAPPPAKGKRRHSRVPLLSYDPTAFVVGRHRRSHAAPKPPPARGKRRHGRLPNVGPAGVQPKYPVRRRRKPVGMPCWTFRIPHRRRPRLPGLVVTSGSYYLAAGQVYAAGPVAAMVEAPEG